MQNIWGEENVPENALSRNFLDPSKVHLAIFSFPGVSRTIAKICTWGQCPQVLAGTARKVAKSTRVCSYAGGVRWKTYRSRGPFWEECHEVFLPPLFSTPPWLPLRLAFWPPCLHQIHLCKIVPQCYTPYVAFSEPGRLSPSTGELSFNGTLSSSQGHNP